MLKKSFFCLALVAVLSIGLVWAQKSNKVKSFILAVGGHNQTAEYGSLIDLKNEKVYKVDEVSYPGDIDLLYAYGQTTKSNLMTPNSTSITQFGTVYKDKVANAWEVKNRGMMVVIKSGKKNKGLFKELKKGDDIERLYLETVKTIKEEPEYNILRNGPSRRLTELEIGDLILFRSQSKQLYAAGFVVGLTEGTKGMIDIDFKVTR
ncbi:hypothetical protein [Sphingobacterium faecale]|uniref:Uncharacterized protein n=1 Tax=Sphingobacterium faecale TaxID=2803775 RepID=A0ABS1QYC7_9SPHI|nr:hypothetical protein [Sphingobacterium faecale]MBL1407423.1 hypothetical protein [Sphingobacterium faecale]